MNEKNDYALVRKLSSAVEKAAPGAKRVLSGMAKDLLALACAHSVTHSDLDALVLEGKRIQRHQGMTPEDVRAFDLFHRAAVAGHCEAQLLVFECYLDGNGVREDVAKALEWFLKSAESGFVEAQRRLADFYQGTHDYVEAVKWFRKAAEQGDVPAQCSLGLCYYDGEGVQQNYAEAAKWVRKAAEQGDIIAQKNLGVFYDRGHGVSQNDGEAVRWYRKAAEQGSAGAQNDLGVCYETGQGVPKNKNEAIKWYRKAAEQGNTEAISNLQRLQ
jgi:TPR repeat protein